MVKLNDLHDIIELEIKSIDEIISPHSRKDWLGIERRIIESGIAPSLPAYLLYEYQFNNKSIRDLAGKLAVFYRGLNNLMKKIGIPILTN